MGGTDLARQTVATVVCEEERRSGLAAAVLDGVVYLAGGHDGAMPLRTFTCYEPEEEENLLRRTNASSKSSDGGVAWAQLRPMLARRAYCSACEFKGNVYVFGGSADGRTLNTFEVFDPDTQEWAQWFTKPPMQIKRTLHASAVADGRLFVCGGFDGARDLALMEEYSHATGSWKLSSSMAHGRSYFAMVPCSGAIYALGGQDRGGDAENPRAHRSAEKFDLYSERWLEVSPMREGRVGCAGGRLVVPGAGPDGQDEEFIYVCGGASDGGTSRSMERYCPRTDAWDDAPPMGDRRLGHAVAVVRNRLYAFGGFDGREPLGTFECFDPIANRWGAVQPMEGGGPEGVGLRFGGSCYSSSATDAAT